MEIPKYHETFIPILNVLKDYDDIHHQDLRMEVKNKYYSNLSEELLDKRTRTGANMLLDRIGWGMYIMKMANLVTQPKRGFFKITEKGRALANKGIFTLEDLKNDPDYLKYQERRENGDDSDKVEESETIATPSDLIDEGFTRHEEQVKINLLEKLKEVNPYYFEEIVLKLLKRMGYGDYKGTKKSRDGGIDGILNQDHLGIEKIYIQAKRFDENLVREHHVNNFIGAMSGGSNKGIFVTTSEFDERAKNRANQNGINKIVLIDGKKLVDLMYEHSVGVQVRFTFDFKELDEDFFSI